MSINQEEQLIATNEDKLNRSHDVINSNLPGEANELHGILFNLMLIQTRHESVFFNKFNMTRGRFPWFPLEFA